MRLFRYKFSYYDNEGNNGNQKGFIFAGSYSDAACKIEKINTTPSGICQLEELTLYEEESMFNNSEMIDDELIIETLTSEHYL